MAHTSAFFLKNISPIVPNMWVASSTSESYLYFNIFLFKISDVHSSNDKVEGSKLSSEFDETCKAWKVGNKKLI